MSAWRRKALEALPEQKRLIQTADSPMPLWLELHTLFEGYVRDNDDARVRAILGFAAWCVSDASGPLPNDTSTAAICAFYEDIAENKANWPKFADWFSAAEFHTLKEFFGYHLSAEELSTLEKTYAAGRGKARA